MAYTQADLDAIDAQIAAQRGIESTSIADRSVKFAPLADLYAERARIAAAIAAQAGTTKTRYVATRKGV